MPNIAAYDASLADWERLRQFAHRVARDTREPRQPPIVYTTQDFVDVPTNKSASGVAGLFGKTVTTTIRQERTREVVVIGEHWVLDRRHHHIERNIHGKDYRNQETTHEQHYYLLLPDGSLKHACVWEEEFVSTSNGRTTVRAGQKEHLLNELGSDWDLKVFDYEKYYRESGTHVRGTKTWGDREPGRRLLVHAKGVGLSMALKRLLPSGGGRADSPSRPTTSHTHSTAPPMKPPVDTPSRLRGSLVRPPRTD